MFKKIDLKVKYPRKKWIEIERKAELKMKIKHLNKFSGDIIGVEMTRPVTEDEIRVLRKQRRDRKYYHKHKKRIATKRAQKYWEQRLYGATPLNEYFVGSNGHHITTDFLIYIPKDLHTKYSHSLELGRHMDKINIAVIEWLRSENNNITASLVEEHLEGVDLFTPAIETTSTRKNRKGENTIKRTKKK
jgi:hypothetical protein